MSDAVETRILLLVEDNPGDAQLVREYLAEAGGDSYRVIHVPRIALAVEAIQSNSVDVILLDLGLPDCEGLESVRKLHEAAADTPIVVITGNASESLAIACMDAGAQDYLGKDDLRAHSLRRAIGYATARLREAQLRETQATLARLRELSSSAQGTTVTAALAGSGALFARSPNSFEALKESYFRLLEPHIGTEGQRLRPPREEMERIATALGDANAGPRDLLDVHLAALERALKDADERTSKYLVLETRLLALQMMGLLVDFYRVGHRRHFSDGGQT